MKCALSILCFFLLPLPKWELAAHTRSDTIPEVHFAVIRLDYLTYTIEGFYEFSQSFRKSLPEEGFLQAGNVFYKQVPATDFGFTQIQSRFTEELLVYAQTVWAGAGSFLYPPDSLFSTTYEQGYTNPGPDTLIFLPLFGSTPEQADSAWTNVRGTDIITRLAALDVYEVILFDHYYSVGFVDPQTAEWIVIAFTHPPAPDDMAFVGMTWPKTLMTRNIRTTPEIVVHNFGDYATDIDIHITAMTSSGPIHESTQAVGMVPADSSRLVFFDPVTPTALDSVVMSFHFLKPNGLPWEDAYPENDTWQQKKTTVTRI